MAGVLVIALSAVGGASPVAASSATEPEPGGQIVGGETAEWDSHPYFAVVVGTGQTDDDEPSSQGIMREVTGRIRSDGDMADFYDLR